MLSPTPCTENDTGDMLNAKQRCQTWASDELNLKEDASSETLRKVFLKNLHDGFSLPSEDHCAAFHYLQAIAETDADVAFPERFIIQEENRLNRAVEKFARNILHIPPPHRKEQWEELYNQCRGTLRPLLRCELLRPGLDVDMSDISSKDTDSMELATKLSEMLIAVPIKRGKWRQQIRDLWKDEPSKASRVAKRFRHRYPNFAAIDSLLIQELVNAPKLWKLRRVPPVKPKKQPVQQQSLFLRFVVMAIVVAVFTIVLRGIEAGSKRKSPGDEYREWERIQKSTPRLREIMQPYTDTKLDVLLDHMDNQDNTPQFENLLKSNKP